LKDNKLIDSPITPWNLGCQLVALNYQTAGEEMWLNNGKFLDNGFFKIVFDPEYQFKK
jgi:hypothetical protein